LPHIPPLLHCFPKPPVVSVTCAQVFDVLWQEIFWDWLIHGFLATHDPSRIMEIYSIFAYSNEDEGVVTVPLKAALISSSKYPYCLSSKNVNSSVIIDFGASVCISPNRSDFITYKDSKMKIKDLSSSNKVAGEGILHWKLQDANGDLVHVELLGYHIPNAEVHVRLTQTGQCTQYILGKCTCTIIWENVHVQLSGKMYMYYYPGKCTCTIIRENVQVQLSLLGLSGGHIGDRISLNAIPVTLYSIVTISHKINTMTSFDTEARKDSSLLQPSLVSDQGLTSWDRYPLDE
jgi:hypothetical protein